MGMVKKTISYTNQFTNEPVTEDWYFSLDQSDAVDMELMHRPDVQEYVTGAVKKDQKRDLVSIFKEILFASVGKRVGDMFVKDAETVREFKYGGAFRQLFAELVDSDDFGAELFAAMMPDDVVAQAKEQANKVYTEEELLAMTDDEFKAVAGQDEKDWSREHLLIGFKRKTAKAA